MITITISGEKRTLKEWSHLFGVKESVIRSRINKGWDWEKAIMTPARPRTKKEKKTKCEHCKRTKEKLQVLRKKLSKLIDSIPDYGDSEIPVRISGGQRGRQASIKITHLGETRTIPEWAKVNNIPHQIIRQRIRKGWPEGQAVSTPVRKIVMDEFIPGVTQSQVRMRKGYRHSSV